MLVVNYNKPHNWLHVPYDHEEKLRKLSRPWKMSLLSLGKRIKLASGSNNNILPSKRRYTFLGGQKEKICWKLFRVEKIYKVFSCILWRLGVKTALVSLLCIVVAQNSNFSFASAQTQDQAIIISSFHGEAVWNSIGAYCSYYHQHIN